MSITSALNTANSGLSAASRRANVVSNNVANALTPGYARRDVNISENVIAGAGAGVQFNGVTRATDPALTSDRRRAESAQAFEQLTASTHASFNSALGEPEDPFSLFAQYQNLETGLRSLAQTPESQPLQAQVLDAAKALVGTLNNLSTQTLTARQNADAKIAQEVGLVNDKLQQIVDLNKEISIGQGGNRDVTSLEDQRKLLIDDVSKIIPVREVVRDNGKVDLMTEEGAFLIANTVRPLQFTQATVVAPDSSLAGGDLSGLSVSGSDLTPGGGGTFSLRAGSLAGHFAIRDDVAPDFQTKIDALARDVIERFENIDPTLAPGAPGLFTDAGTAFDPTAEIGLAGRIAINAAVDPDQGGAAWRLRDGIGAATEGPAGAAGLINTMIDALTGLKAPPPGAGLSGQLSAAGAAANVTSTIGASRISAETQLAATSARAQALSDAELAVTGVDTDFELQQLILIEQAFAANARVIQTAEQMVLTLLEI